jgi:hypothetical protein
LARFTRCHPELREILRFAVIRRTFEGRLALLWLFPAES